MALLIHMYVAVAHQVRRLNHPENRDRGDSPVTTVIIIAGLAVLAIGVLTWAVALAGEYMSTEPGGIPAVNQPG